MNTLKRIHVNQATQNADIGFQSSLWPQIAEEANDTDAMINVYPKGCLVGELDTNCSLACADSTYLFNSTWTVANCMAFAAVAVNSSETTTVTQATGTYLGSEHIADFDVASLLNNLVTFTSAVCNSSASGSCSPSMKSSLSQLDVKNSHASLIQVFTVLSGSKDADYAWRNEWSYFEGDHFCKSAQAQPHGDVAGPGELQRTLVLEHQS